MRAGPADGTVGDMRTTRVAAPALVCTVGLGAGLAGSLESLIGWRAVQGVQWVLLQL